MKVGFYFCVRPEAGGEYQYACTLLENLVTIPGHEYLVYNFSKRDLPSIKRRQHVRYIRLNRLTATWSGKLVSLMKLLFYRVIPLNRSHPLASNSYLLLSNLLQYLSRGEIAEILADKPDIVVYPVAEITSFLTPVPGIVAIHDLQHRIQPRFKEVTTNGKARLRDYIYTMISTQAAAILVDSLTGKKDVYRYYPKTKAKVYSLPYLPPSALKKGLSRTKTIQINRHLKLPGRYLFYPAKFWPHKNHLNLIRALAILKQRGVEVNLVMTGSSHAEYSTFERTLSLIDELDLAEQVKFLGYLKERELATVYRQALALIMPTYFGPTNIPILEAWQARIPVLCSNYNGSREQIGSAGLLFDPDDPHEMANKIERLLSNPPLMAKLIKLGTQRLNRWSPVRMRKALTEVLKSSATITADERYRNPQW